MFCLGNCKWNSRVVPVLLLACLALLPSPSPAQTASVIFERANIRIDPLAPAPKDSKPPRASVSYNVEVRGEDALKLEYIHALNTLSDTTGVMIVFTAPTMVGLPAWHDYTSVDALFLAEDGTVLQILPDVILADLAEEVIAKQPVKAFLFLAQGQVTARHILPHDVVAGAMFTPAPPVMQ